MTLFDDLPEFNREEGERRRDSAFRKLEAHRDHLIRAGRRAMLLAALANGRTSIEDARAVVPVPPMVDPKFFGSVPGPLAEAGILKRIGYRPTTRAEGHARPVSLWELADAAKAVKWLADNPAPAPPPNPPDLPPA